METLQERKESPNEARYRRSVQREKILGYLKNRYDHPSASRIYSDLKPEIPSLSLGNLYRNLGILVDLGLVLRISESGKDEDRYDAHTEQHYHFTCDRCGELHDIAAESDPDISARVNARSQYKIISSQVLLRGLCPKCQKTS